MTNRGHSGSLRKMRAVLSDPVDYFLVLDETEVPLNEILGCNIKLEFHGLIHCIYCGRKTSKSFNQGYCFPCFRKLARCDLCIVSPEKCHYHEGTCREPKWGQENCMTEHVVYLSITSGLKVGITRSTQVPTRWIDQGATQAQPIFIVSKETIKKTIITKATIASMEDDFLISFPEKRLIFKNNLLNINKRQDTSTKIAIKSPEAVAIS